MPYAYQSHIYLAEAVLNVKDLTSQTAFYHQIIGLEILSQTETEVILGLGRKALADVLKHLSDLRIPLVGGADHGYSEAIYLEDLEVNGIEHKPVSSWDIREDGRIIGVTEALAAQDIYELGEKVDPFS